ncbi:hypothetical protein [Ornithinibacillus salinisoli]|uniref:hypothetical protein n=1 Tax=Ornithinibacillus salinisoli TaxID=1848459 RepID=UPI00366D1911
MLGNTGFLSIITVNLEVWELNKQLEKIIALRLYGVIFVPLTILFLIDVWYRTKGIINKSVSLATFLFLLFLGDFILRSFHVYEYPTWNHWMLILVWVTFFVVLLFAQKLYRRLLKKDEVIS